MKEDDDEKKRLDRSGDIRLGDDGDGRGDHGRLLAQRPDADARTLAHCPRQTIGVGAAVYPCERNGLGHCWRCDGFGLPIHANSAVPDGWAIFVGNGAEHGYVYAVDLAKPDSGVTFRIDADGTLYATPDRDEGGGES